MYRRVGQEDWTRLIWKEKRMFRARYETIEGVRSSSYFEFTEALLVNPPKSSLRNRIKELYGLILELDRFQQQIR
ncbi:hypothetical protein XYCOK13_20690 [Xylanibacillus composti]|uniref:Uncharacterized protein n=1 Tax=Xylanibacillus composti TaxID=1572762 RepID=A0A8J4M2L7_9BACL|nr:hypothetical protein XYCOK13_20690 [Xylanibacillus composti]